MSIATVTQTAKNTGNRNGLRHPPAGSKREPWAHLWRFLLGFHQQTALLRTLKGGSAAGLPADLQRLSPCKRIAISEFETRECLKTPSGWALFGFSMQRMGPAKRTVFTEYELVRSLPLILCRGIVAVLTLLAAQCNDIPSSHLESPYSMISLMTPAPTVRPPSRMANLSSFSIAMGVIKTTSIVTLSPGITISTPSGRVTTPVTSVVRK